MSDVPDEIGSTRRGRDDRDVDSSGSKEAKLSRQREDEGEGGGEAR